MNRKNFLTGLLGSLPAVALSAPLPFVRAHSSNNQVVKSPPYLKPGDCIGIVSPAGFIDKEALEPALQQLAVWGFTTRIGSSIGKRDFTFGGTDEERLHDLQKMLDDPTIKAILCARGGYGVVRIVDRIDWQQFIQHPKWIIGFSDITVLHGHIHYQANVASIHSKMCNSFPAAGSIVEPEQRASIESIKNCLTGVQMEYTVPANIFNRFGDARGELVGGNLKIIESLSATNSDFSTKGKILFVEDTGEYLYSIDRMFWHLKRCGKLANLAALIVGGFKVKPDEEGEKFGKSLFEIVIEKTQLYNFPVCFDFPVGHQKHNMALRCGQTHRLVVDETGAILRSEN